VPSADEKGDDMEPVRWGVISTARIGTEKVLPGMKQSPLVELRAIASRSLDTARAAAAELGIPKAYGSYEELLADPDVQVVHNATPNYLHYPINAAAIAKGKHVVSDKPLAMTAAEAKKLLDAANQAGIVHAVTFNYRGNPLVQEARLKIARGDIGKPHFLVGWYLQDWLIKDTDYSWRLEPDKGGASSALGDIGSHWCDLAQHISGLRITHVLGDITTTIPKRKKPRGSREAFQTAGTNEAFDLVDIQVEDLASVLVRFDNGAKGSFSVGQVCAGHKNDLLLEICGAGGSIRWLQEHQNELWLGYRDKANEILQKDPSLLDAEAGGYAHLPGGHQEAWADAFCNVMRDIYAFIAAGKKPSGPHPPAFATFEDGYRANCIVEAIMQSAKQGSVWTKVAY
jgi:predicted dehydrogenase